MKKLFFVMALALALSCTRDKSLNSTVEDGAFAVFLVDNEVDLMQFGVEPPIEAMKLAPVPLFSAADIAYYQWSTHQIWLKADHCPIRIDLMHHHFFVVIAGQERIYYGKFVVDLMSSSVSYERPVFNFGFDFDDKENPYRIGCLCRIDPCYACIPAGKPDPRTDQRIYDALKKAGKLI